MLRNLAILLLLFSSFTGAFAQNAVYELPIYYGQYFNDPQVNSLKFDEDQDLKLLLGHRRNNNNFGGINTSIFSAQYKLKDKSANHHHSIGLQFVNDREGFIIRRNRAYLNYGFHLKVSDDFKFATGVSTGFYNFSVEANSVTGGYSNFAFDGGLRLSLYSKETEVGLTFNQITNSSIQPIDQPIILGRHLNLLVKHSFVLGENVNLIPSLVIRMSKKTTSAYSGLGGTLGLQCQLKEKFSFGMSFENKNGFYFFAGLDNIKIKNSSLDINLSYFTPSYKSIKTNVQLFEVFLGYDISFEKKAK
jgi:hypothetical protein